MKHALAIAALVATSFSVTALPAFAQDAPAAVGKAGHHHVHRAMPQRGMQRGGLGILGLVCSDRGAERLDVAFTRLSHRLSLTATQQPLFDDLRAAALITQTSFADECKTALPQRTAGERPDLVERLKSTIALEQARLTALNDVLPAFEAFYGSLSDEQRATLMPERRDFRLEQRRPDAGRTDRTPDKGRTDRGASPDRIERPVAPGRG